ncbi:hypothetical protein ES708_34059 [subsurface metagenome]
MTHRLHRGYHGDTGSQSIVYDYHCLVTYANQWPVLFVEQAPLLNLSPYLARLILYLLPTQPHSFYDFLIEDNCSIIGNGAKAGVRVKGHRNFTGNNQVEVSFKGAGYLQRHRYTPIRNGKHDHGPVIIFT